VHTCAVHTVGQLQRPGCDSHHMPGLPAAWRNCRRISCHVFAIASLPSDTLHVARATGGGNAVASSSCASARSSGEGGIAGWPQATKIPSHSEASVKLSVTNRISMQVPQYVWSGGSEASVSV
jgi:hypothetical protein